jgi:flagellin-like hook-associated protein FlgL
MSSITQVSSYARYLNTVRTLSTTQNNVDELTRQLTSGKKSTDLTAFGADTQKLLNLRAELVQRQNYVTSIDTALPRVQAYDKVLEKLEKITTDWQSSAIMPFEPGPPTIEAPVNKDVNALSFKVNTNSSFTQSANYTVTAVPASPPATNGTFDVTVSDGLGGTTTRAINLQSVPPDDGKGYNFTINGGPGSGAVLNLSFDKLTAASSSTFKVTYQQADDMRSRVEGAMRDVRQYLNERFGDRYLFSGSRYDLEPVKDLNAGQKTTCVTFNGPYVEDQDYFEVSVNGQTFAMSVVGTTLQFTSNDGSAPPPIPVASPAALTTSNLAHAFATCINTYANPKLPVSIIANQGVLTLTAQGDDVDIDVKSHVLNATTFEDSISPPVSVQNATTTLPQVDSVTLQGTGVDIGDTFSMTFVVGSPDDPFNQRYYAAHPNEPQDLPPYKEYKVSYTVTPADMQTGTPFTVNDVAGRMVSQLAAMDPPAPVTLAVVPAGSSTLQISSKANLPGTHPGQASLFTTKAAVTNGSLQNTVSVSTLPPESSAVMNRPNTSNPTLPYYDAEYPAVKENAKAWDTSRVTADDGYSIEYGLTSTDPAFQTMVQAMRMIRVAASNPGKYQEYVSQARDLMAKAQQQVRSVHAKVASDLATLSTQKDLHKSAMDAATSQVAGIEGIDETEVAARLRSAMSAQEAAYTVIGQQKKLSLLNYLA